MRSGQKQRGGDSQSGADPASIEMLLERVPALLAERDQVAQQLTRLLSLAASSWPSWIESGIYVAHIGNLLSTSDSPLTELARLGDKDLYLVAAVVHGSRPAVAAAERRIRRVSKKVVQRMRGSDAAASDIASETVEKLLVGSPGRPPCIGDYRGRGSLSGWIRAIVTRGYLDSLRKAKRELLIGDDAVFDAMERKSGEAAMSHLKSECRAEFAAAFETAIARLSHRQRGVLRYRFVDGASIEAIASVYGIHRATCHRWLNDARAALAENIKACLQLRLGGEVRVSEMRALVESQLDLSLSRMFRTQ